MKLGQHFESITMRREVPPEDVAHIANLAALQVRVSKANRLAGLTTADGTPALYTIGASVVLPFFRMVLNLRATYPTLPFAMVSLAKWVYDGLSCIQPGGPVRVIAG